MRQKSDYSKEFDSIQNSLAYIRPVTNNEEINKEYIDIYTTKQQQDRDKEITKLLRLYVLAYKSKTKSNKWYKRIIVAVCVVILLGFSMTFMYFIKKVAVNNEVANTENLIQVVSVCVTFLGLIVGLLQTITKYVFPENDEEYITRIVELIQNNDLENKKENIKVKGLPQETGRAVVARGGVYGEDGSDWDTGFQQDQRE